MQAENDLIVSGGLVCPLFYWLKMIKKEELNHIIETILTEEKELFEDKDLFLVGSKISSDNRITVLIDCMKGIKVNDCATLSKIIESKFDREKEDFELLVSSAGLDRPFQVIEQYHKNIGRTIKVLTVEGEKVKGKLINVSESEIELDQEQKKKENIINKLKFSDIKEAKIVITF